MSIQIISRENTETRTYITMQGKRNEVVISHHNTRGSVDVIVNNASHQAWNGAGKTYRNFDEAKSAYKSSEMQAMIDFVKESVA
jgi:hypothetical protein